MVRFVVKNKIHIKDDFSNIDEDVYFYIGTEEKEPFGYKFTFSKSIKDAVIIKTKEQAEMMIKILKNVYRNYVFEVEEIN